MSWRLDKFEKLTNDKWINLYNTCFSDGEKQLEWGFASRRKLKDLEIKSKKNICDAVCIAPVLKKGEKEYIILVKEFRFPLNDYIYDFPAGLIDKGEDILTTAKREALEEIGAEGDVELLTGVGFNSPGSMDETISLVIMNVKSIDDKKTAREEDEDIETVFVDIEDIESFLKGKKLSVKTEMFCRLYLREYRLKKELEQLKKEYKQK